MTQQKNARSLDGVVTKIVHRGYLYTLGVAILSAVMLIWPKQAVSIAYFTCAIVLILWGLWRVIRYFRTDAAAAKEQQLLTSGSLRIILGVMMLIYNTDVRLHWMQAICGAAMLVIGSIRLQAAFDLKRSERGNWFIPLSASVIAVVLGVVALLGNQFNVLLMLGIVLCIETLADLYCRLIQSSIDRQVRREARQAAAESASAAAAKPEESNS